MKKRSVQRKRTQIRTLYSLAFCFADFFFFFSPPVVAVSACRFPEGAGCSSSLLTPEALAAPFDFAAFVFAVAFE
ncbi:hypothetical protein BJ742DRAFT_821821 [Cladochytrium replicatum]|nr:hypothetical protein BJ742DRAFT_821821 [Cladochytrium replicatum]